MGLIQEVRQSFRALVESGNVRYTVWPDAAAGAAVVNAAPDAAWAWAAAATSQTIIAAAKVADPCWLAGLAVLQSTHAAATTYGDIRVGTGALAAEVWLAIFPVLAGVETAVGLGGKIPCFLPFPIKVNGSPRICGQTRNSAGGVATGYTVKVVTAEVVGN